MNEPTNPLAGSPDSPMRRWNEGARMAPSQAPGADMPGRIERTAPLAYVSDVIGLLRTECDRYQGRGEMSKKAAVERCIEKLKAVFK